MTDGKSYSIDEAKKALEHYCAYQERCHMEIRRKLRAMRMIPEASEIIIAHLIAHGYLNEQRFADAFVRGKFRIKKWGRRRLISELKSRDISIFAINQSMKQISEQDYITTFEKLSQKKFMNLRETSKVKMKRKLADFLIYRGWETHLVYDKVNQLVK